MNKAIKKFNEFRKDEDGVFYYYDTENIQDMWSYDLDALADYIIKLQEENTTLRIQISAREEICRKAIKYINNNKLYDFDYDKEELFEIVSDKVAKDYLLFILQGN